MILSNTSSTPAVSYGAGKTIFAFILIGGACLGCSDFRMENWIKNGWLDPTQVGEFDKPMRTEIRSVMSMFEEPEGIPDAEEPSPEDLEARFSEAKIAPGDILRVSIYELQAPGITSDQQIQVRNSGNETFPVIGSVKIAGFTPTELEAELRRVLADRQILEDADVQVSVLRSEAQQFTVVGNIQAPGNYPLPSPNYRLLNAIGAVGGIPTEVDTIYVFRKDDPASPTATSSRGRSSENWWGGSNYTLNDLSGGGGRRYAQAGGMKTEREEFEQLEARPMDGSKGQPVFDPATGEWRIDSTPNTNRGPVEVPVVPNNRPTTQPGDDETVPLSEEVLADGRRVLAIPSSALLSGDPNYNIVIRPRDIIRISVPNAGEYFMGGNIQAPGPYRLTGRKITVKQAIISAGGFAPLAYPSRATLTRRITPNEEQMIQINLDAIFANETPDFFVRPNDTINVGSAPWMYFLAVVRNAFRASYGFGFVYDRNFADSDSFQAQEQIRQRELQEKSLRGLPI